MGCNWRCGLSKEIWSRIIGIIDIVKGTAGFIFSIYLCFTIIPWIFQAGDFVELRHDMKNSTYIYILAYGHTRGGVVLCLLGATLWNLCLIVFGIILLDGMRKTETTRLRLWYIYSLLSNIAFCGFYFRWGQTVSETWDESSGLGHGGWMGLLILYYFCMCFIPTIYSLAVVHSVVQEIYQIQRDKVPLNLRRKSVMPPTQDSKL